MMQKIFSKLKYVLFLGAGLFLVWWQLKNMTSEEQLEFRHALKYADYWVVFPVIVMSLLSHISRSMRWKLLMEPLGYKPALKNVFAVTMVGYLANSAIPRLGEILKCTFLARYEKLKVDKLVGTILVERTFDLICYAIFILITVAIQINVVGNFVRREFAKMGTSNGLPVWAKLLVIVACIVSIIVLLKWLFKKYPNNFIINKLNGFISGIGAGFSTIKTLKKRRAFILHTIFIWTMYMLQIYVGFLAMDGTAHLSIAAACSVLSLATLAMIATPGGIGSFPIFVMKVLRMYAIGVSVGTAFGWLMWGVSTGIIVVFGLLALILLPIMNRTTPHTAALRHTEELEAEQNRNN